MPFELYVHFFRQNFHSRDHSIGCRTFFGDENPGLVATIVMERILSPGEKHCSDFEIIDSTDGGSFPIMCSRPCLQMLGNASFQLHFE